MTWRMAGEAVQDSKPLVMSVVSSESSAFLQPLTQPEESGIRSTKPRRTSTGELPKTPSLVMSQEWQPQNPRTFSKPRIYVTKASTEH
ncbi:hypothetical protein PAXRUDRAFT_829436 [Paxillus rubicundulus Ve08.2h10]|uniref:Uncharacterized protein n=1 Tax=Paxillus rubicundulus Ve08.2h10 TaxID=930991 RepID=A0A0D0E037_9AGAM|nr:hypothetical protein PAXRUDRAFT_829436 [Paxillus rubicundulus Ve08.2h10]